MLGQNYDLGDNGCSQQGLKCAGFPGHLLIGRFENQFIHGRKNELLPSVLDHKTHITLNSVQY